MKNYLLTVFFFVVATMAHAVIIQDFESIAKIWDATDKEGTFFVYSANFAPLTLVDNPNKSGINTSNKAVAVQVYTNAPNSGIVKINFPGGSSVAPILNYPTCPLCTDGRYDRLRFKYYKGSLLNRYFEFEPNGAATSPHTLAQAQGMDEWEYITFDLAYATYSSMQFRVNRNDAGTGSAVGTAAGDIIYIDDVEFYNSTDGPTATVPVKEEANKLKCNDLGNGFFSFEKFIGQKSNVRVDLISMGGISENIYNKSAEGDLDVAFEIKGKGIYCVRMTIDNKATEIVKVLSK